MAEVTTAKAIYKVLGAGGSTYEVDLAGRTCSCSTPKDRQCAHYKLIRELVSKSKTANFQVISALHKEIRRGDVRNALMWLRWAKHIRGPSRAKGYLKSILFEETKNMELFKAWHPTTAGLTPEEMLKDMLRSRKAWEVPSNSEGAVIVNRAQYDGIRMPGIKLEEVKAPDKDDFEFYHWFRMFTRIMCIYRRSPKDRWGHLHKPNMVQPIWGTFCELLCDALEDAGYDSYATFMEGLIKLRDGPPYHYAHQAMSLVSGMVDTAAAELGPVPGLTYDDLDVDAMVFPPYVFDWHTNWGKVRVSKWDRLDPGPTTPMPAGVDLRWGGQFICVWWRWNAYKLYGDDFRYKEWHEPPADSREWEIAMDVDKFWRGLNPLNRRWRTKRV